jgi:hypothetical protein
VLLEEARRLVEDGRVIVAVYIMARGEEARGEWMINKSQRSTNSEQLKID